MIWSNTYDDKELGLLDYKIKQMKNENDMKKVYTQNASRFFNNFKRKDFKRSVRSMPMQRNVRTRSIAEILSKHSNDITPQESKYHRVITILYVVVV